MSSHFGVGWSPDSAGPIVLVHVSLLQSHPGIRVFECTCLPSIGQACFKHLFKPGNEHVPENTQNFVDKEWEKLLQMEESTTIQG